jgi:hypothetical protein
MLINLYDYRWFRLAHLSAGLRGAGPQQNKAKVLAKTDPIA